MQSKTLVVKDDRDIAQLLAVTMKKAGCVAESGDGYEELKLTRSRHSGLIILDLMLPGTDGVDLCEEIDRIIGLELGADDCVFKCFNPSELLLRVRVILRRGGHEYQPKQQIFKRSGLEIDFESYRASLNGQQLVLTAVQFKLLAELVKSRGKVLSREHLLDAVWGYAFEGYNRCIDTHISRLRQKLLSCADWIETVRGVGYRFQG